MKERKIESLVDTLGLPVRLVVNLAGLQDSDGTMLFFEKMRRRFPWVACVFADTGYNAQQTFHAAGAKAFRFEITRLIPDAVGFEVMDERWVVERTFPWFGRNRRFAKDFETLA